MAFSSSVAVVVVLAVVFSALLGMGRPASATMACKDCNSTCSSSANSAPSSWDPCGGACGTGTPPNCLQGCKSLYCTQCTNSCMTDCSRTTNINNCAGPCTNPCSQVNYEPSCRKDCCSSPLQCQQRKDSYIQTCVANCKTHCV